MTEGVLALVLVPVIDQIVKAIVRRALGARSVPLAAIGELRLVQSPIWMIRASSLSSGTVWGAWIVAALMLIALALIHPGLGWAAGLLLGGSLSHALETSARGTVSDYICLRFWPPFNLADVALSAGLLGLIIGACRMLMPAGA